MFSNSQVYEKMSHYTLDARNTLCPMPVIKTQNRIAELQAGDELEVTCTDPGALNDIPAWCRINGHTVKDTREEGNEVVILIEVSQS
jgi:tRNA 2-thiouridine synthesizing protein A